MNKLISLLVAVVLVMPAVGLAQVSTPTLPDPGTLPDSPFYFLKSWREGIQLFFTFDVEKKAEQYLHLAEVRLAEYEKMVEKGKEEIAQKTLEKYEDQLGRALAKAKELKAKGEEVADELKTKAEEAAAKHLEVLERNLEKVSESAKEGIERALEASRKVWDGLNVGDEHEGDEREATSRAAGNGKEDSVENATKDLNDVKDLEDEDVSSVPADWKTYRNEQYGFEVKYPPSLSFSQNNSGVIEFTDGTVTQGYSLRIIDQSATQQFLFTKDSLKNNLIIEKYPKFTIFSVSGFETGGNLFVVPLPNDKFLTLASCDCMIDLRKEILSTFKFISPNSRGDTSNSGDFRNLIDDKGLENELNDLLEGLE